MSAIFGIYTGDRCAPEPAEMQRLRAYLARRGPDASGVRIESGLAMGNCLLRTTPESRHEQMPSSGAEGNCWITADARLDNRDDLIGELGLRQYPASEIPDSTIILEAFQKWSEDCPTHLLGDFAFAIWDRKTRTLFCARDQFGIKPFYYSQVSSRLAFCSCIDGLLRLDWIPRRLNELRLTSYLTRFFGDTAATFYADILRLPPAHSLIVNEHGVRLTRYWALNPSCETRFSSDEQCVEAFQALFREAVKTRLRRIGQAGSMLSGGLDSSSISAMAGRLVAEEGRGPLATFSAVFDEVPRTNERRFIVAAVEHGGFEPSYLAADQCNPFLAPPELDGTQVEAHYAANLFLNWGLFGMAQKRGVRVLLDGFDGDSTISHGINYVMELGRANRFLEVSRLVTAAAGVSGRSPAGLWWSYVWHLGLAPKIPSGVIRVGRGLARRWRRWISRNDADSGSDCVLDSQFAERIGLREYRKSFPATAQPSARTEKEAHYQKLMWGVMPATLEWLEQASAPFGLELRFPFWDRRLIEFCLGLPPRFKIRDGYTRWILHKAMDGILPPEVQWRAGKSNMGHGFTHCLLKHGQSALVHGVAAAPSLLRPYVCARQLEDARRQSLATVGDEKAFLLWHIANLSLWLEKSGLRT